MKSFISEDAIEKAFINQLVVHNGWKHIVCDPSPDAKDEPGPSWRASTAECVLPEILRSTLERLNPCIDREEINRIFADLRRDFSGEDMTDVNYRLLSRIRNGIQ